MPVLRNTAIHDRDQRAMRKTLALWLGINLTLAAACGRASGDLVLRTAAQIGSAPKFDVPSPGSRAVTGICVDIFRAMEAAQPGLHIVGDGGERLIDLVRQAARQLACGDQSHYVRKLHLMPPDVFLGSFSLDEIADLRAKRVQYLQRCALGLPNGAAEERHDAEHVPTGPQGKSERPMESQLSGDGAAAE